MRSLSVAVVYISFAFAVRADDLKAVAAPAAKAESSREKTESIQRLKKPLQPEKLVTYSGFLVDVSHTNHPAKLLSLRKPLDSVHDGENLHFEMRPARPAVFRLFSIDF